MARKKTVKFPKRDFNEDETKKIIEQSGARVEVSKTRMKELEKVFSLGELNK